MNAKLLIKQAKQWVKGNPTFVYDPDSSSLEGLYEFRHPETQEFIDGYYIKVVLYKRSLSTSFPYVFETKGRIAWELDKHMYSDGRMCLTTKLIQYHACRKGMDFSTFMEAVVRPFLATHLLLEMGEIDSFPQGEYSHGGKGIIEGYRDHIGVEDPHRIIEILNTTRTKQQPNQPCFCGSGIKHKKCCRSILRRIRFIRPTDIDHEIKWITNYFQETGEEKQSIESTFSDFASLDP